jgi:hypothetical protein
MNIEEEVAATLHDMTSHGGLSEGFAERTVTRLPHRPDARAKLPAAIVGSLATACMLLVLAALIAPMIYRPGSGGIGSTIQFNSAGLGLNYPSSWHASQSGLMLHYERVLEFIGTGEGSITCGSDYVPGLGGTCAERYVLAANSVVVKVSVWDGPPTPGGAVAYVSSVDPQSSTVAVGGYPAVLRTLPADPTEDLVLEWTLSKPGDAQGSYRLTAHFKGPDIATSRSEVEALIQSASFGK